MKLSKGKFTLLFLGAILILLLPFIIYVAQSSQEIRNQAVNYFSFQQNPGTYDLYFEPTDILLTSGTQVKVMANYPNVNVAFARVAFTFDPTKVQLSSELTTTPNLSTSVENTTMAAANSSGRVVFVIAASYGETQPTGNFELANFNLVPASGVNAATTPSVVGFDTADMQIVDSTGNILSLNAASANVTFDASQTPAPTTPPVNTPPVGGIPTDIPPTGAVPTDITNPTNPPANPTNQPGQNGGESENDDDDKNENGKDKNGSNSKDKFKNVIEKKIGDINKDGKFNWKDVREWFYDWFRKRFNRINASRKK